MSMRMCMYIVHCTCARLGVCVHANLFFCCRKESNTSEAPQNSNKVFQFPSGRYLRVTQPVPPNSNPNPNPKPSPKPNPDPKP